MSGLTIPMVLFASNYLAGSVSLGNMHVAAAVLMVALLVSTLGIVLNIEPTQVQRPHLVTSRPALQH